MLVLQNHLEPTALSSYNDRHNNTECITGHFLKLIVVTYISNACSIINIHCSDHLNAEVKNM